jgi:hypothetical protein
LLAVWGRQTCRNRADWPATLDRLLKDAPATPGGTSHGRASLEPAVEGAIAALAAAFAAGPPADPAEAVWRAFPKLDREHCGELAGLLTAEASPPVAPTAPTGQRRTPRLLGKEEAAA